MSNLITAQIWQGAKFVRSIYASHQISVHKLGNVPNLSTQILELPKLSLFMKLKLILATFKFVGLC